MVDGQLPLTWEHSSATSQPIVSDRLPEEVVACLQNARFLHLATCTANEPHVSLMNYTYLPPNTRPPPASDASPSQHPSQGPTIVMTSNPQSKKTTNLLENPNVSLLVHDWVSARPPNVSADGRDRSPTGGARRQSTLATMLMQMNSAAVSSISTTINGHARVLTPGSEEEKWYKEQHLANNTFDDDSAPIRRPMQQRALSSAHIGAHDTRVGDGGRECYIEDEDVRVVVVEIRDGRISDWKGGVKDWVIRSRSGEEQPVLVNGV